ncbi:MAG: ImmA/IrrE family metallo-endopeptidase, partial [Pyrinomonadaceae bacterium]
MSVSQYYQQMRRLALEKRAEYQITTDTLNLTAVRKIYKIERVRIDSWDIKGRKIKAAYFCDDTDSSVLVNKNLPKTPRLFALVHELKHHYTDQESIRGGKLQCGDYNANQITEVGAELFAAEFIYPESEMKQLAEELNIWAGACTPEKIIEFKRLCPATVSYIFLVKRFEWFNFIG